MVASRTSGARSKRGTPQGGVISPLLANLYLHWFEQAVSSSRWTGLSGQMPNWYAMPTTLSCWRAIKVHVCKAGLEAEDREVAEAGDFNRDKTRVVDLREEKASLDFLGYTFRWLRARPLWPRPAISARGTVEEGAAKGAGSD